jgi:hypothetical protein
MPHFYQALETICRDGKNGTSQKAKMGFSSYSVLSVVVKMSNAA